MVKFNLNGKECVGEVFSKKYPYFFLHSEDTIKEEGELKVGKIETLDTNKIFFIVEDQYSATRYEDRECALEHFKENVELDKKFKEAL